MWTVLAVSWTAPVGLWAAGPAGNFDTAALALRSVSVALGIAGFSGYALNLVLGARLRSVDRAFGGMDRVYRVHRRIGVIVLVLLVGHAFLWAAALPSSSLVSGLKVVLGGSGWPVAIGVAALSLLIGGLLVTLFVPVSHETFVWVQRLMGAVFGLGAVHALLVPGAKASTPGLRPYLLALTAAGAAAFLYRSVLGRWLVPRRGYTVEEVTKIAPDVVEIAMAPRAQPMRFVPGQFALVRFRGGGVWPEAHPFSVASGVSEARLRIVVKALGDFTEGIGRLRPGTPAEIEGPFGGFGALEHPNPHQVWVAGGIGITPFLSMARSLDGRCQVDLYYCTEAAEEAHYLDELFEIADRTPGLRVVPVRKVWLGYLTAEDIGAASLPLQEQDIFICGPPAMMRTLRRQLLDRGVPRAQVHFEDFSFA